MDAIEYIRRNAEVSVGTKQIHTLEGIDRAITFSVTLFAPYDSYTGMESTWDAARLDDLLGAQCKDSAPAGGDSLRALVKELRESLEGVVRVADRNTDEFDRAREAIARASHVFVNAGDSEAQFIADGENLDCPACGGSCHAGDSAPAGSGEVDGWKKWPIINRLQMQANDCEDAADENSDAIITALQLKAMASDLREAAALLRKLQQGADYVMVPREALRTEARRLRYRAGECWPTFSTGTDAGAQMIGTAESLERLASQDQEGGK